jgi:hypothetical protein
MLGDFTSWRCNGEILYLPVALLAVPSKGNPTVTFATMTGGVSSFNGRGSSRPNTTCTAADASTLDSHFTVEDCVVTNIPVE